MPYKNADDARRQSREYKRRWRAEQRVHGSLTVKCRECGDEFLRGNIERHENWCLYGNQPKPRDRRRVRPSPPAGWTVRDLDRR